MIADSFYMNGYLWKFRFISPNDERLVDRTETLRVATTDPEDLCVYLSSELHGDFLMTVVIHELSHCALYSFHLIDTIHKYTKREHWIDMEEFICNFLADYGLQIFKIGYQNVGYRAWEYIPNAFEKLIA